MHKKQETGPRRLRLRKESLRQLDPTELEVVAGGRAKPRTYNCTRSEAWDSPE